VLYELSVMHSLAAPTTSTPVEVGTVLSALRYCPGETLYPELVSQALQWAIYIGVLLGLAVTMLWRHDDEHTSLHLGIWIWVALLGALVSLGGIGLMQFLATSQKCLVLPPVILQASCWTMLALFVLLARGLRNVTRVMRFSPGVLFWARIVLLLAWLLPSDNCSVVRHHLYEWFTAGLRESDKPMRLQELRDRHVALREMVADPEVENSVENLRKSYEKHMHLAAECVREGLDIHLEHMYKVLPELPLNLLMIGTIERGRDVSHGGVDHYNMCCDGSALATVADSFAAVEQRIEQEGRLTWEELIDLLDRDYEDAEPIRLMLKNIDRFGSGGSRADAYAVELTQLFCDKVKESPTPDGFNCIPGLFSWANTIGLGKAVGATPNGRHAHAPIAHGANPDPGFRDAGAPTALALAIASVQCDWGNTVPIQMELDPGIARQEEGIEKMKALITTFCDLNGTLMNLNVLSKEQVLEAHEDPEKYPDLIVRVTGFSAYFRMLSKDFRQLVVDRIIADN